MNRFFSLLKTDLRLSLNRSGQFGQESRKKKSRFMTKTVMFIFLTLIGLSMGFTGFATMRELMAQHIEGFMPQFLAQFGVIMVALTMFSFVPATFFFAEQTRVYLSLPLTNREIVAMKLVSLTIEGYLALVYVSVPMALGAWVAMPSLQSLFGWAALLLLLPLVPTCMVTLFMFLCVKVFPFLRDEQRLVGVMSIVSVIGVVVYIFAMQSGQADATVTTGMFMETPEWMQVVFPALALAPELVFGTLTTGFIRFGLLLLISLIWLGVTFFVASRLYIPLILSMQTHSTGKKLSKEQTTREVSTAATPFKALMKRECKSALRSPVVLIQGVLTPYLMVAVIWGGLVFGFVGAAKGEGASDLLGSLRLFLYTFLSDPTNAIVGGLVAALATAMQVTIGGLSTTALSRDAYHLDFLRSLPVTAETIFRVKLLTAYGFILPCIVILWIPLFIIVPFHPLFHIVGVPASLLLTFCIEVIELTIDIKNPRLDWMDENAVFRNNRNVVFGALISLGMLVIVVPMVFLGWFKQAVVVATLLYAVIGISLLFYLERNAERLLQRMGNEA